MEGLCFEFRNAVSCPQMVIEQASIALNYDRVSL